MDSLTQMTLGAACGEIVLGKKLGNRAMLWGAIGGTIPDLDVIGNLFLDEVGALAFHRGISHSLLFAVIAPMLLSWFVHRLYSSNLYKTKGYKISIFVLSLLFIGFVGFIINFIPYQVSGGINWLPFTGAIALFGSMGYWLYSRYLNSELKEVNVTRKEWAWLFFWSIFTHPLLDCCTAYGTQLFQPFWDYRVAFNNISVVDPLYTFWFLLFLTIAGYLTRESSRRRLLTWFSILFSSGYLLFTFYHKCKIDTIFEKSLTEQNIQYNRYMTSPTIANNILWNCLAEGDTAYYHGLYSVWDTEEKVKDIRVISKNHELLKPYEGTREIETLQWFSNNYYKIDKISEDTLIFNDLRYGSLSSQSDNYVFHFLLKKTSKNTVTVEQAQDSNIPEGELSNFWKRLKGI